MLFEVLRFAVGALRLGVLKQAECGPKVEWGTKIVWHTSLKEAEEVSVKTKRPIMVIIYNEECPSCRILIPKLANDEQVVALARNFAVVALHDNDAPQTMRIDGSYIPRIYFTSPSGEVHAEYFNAEGNPRYKFFFANERVLANMMKKILSDYEGCKGPCKSDPKVSEKKKH